MKLRKLLALPIFASLICGAFAFSGSKSVISTSADSIIPTPRSGTSGTLLFVNGQGTYFKSGEADCAICCVDSNNNYAWSERCTYRASGDNIRVMIPYLNGTSHTWSRFKICRYNPSLDPRESGDNGVFNETDFIYFSSFMYQHNVITINGYGSGNKINYAEMKSSISYFGIRADYHVYLDLSGFTDWEKDNAKFAIWFAYANCNNESGWGQSYYNNNYYSSFCWKVNGQDNDHLYECVVPSYGSATVWNMVIAVRLDQYASEPNWNQAYNQTADLKFDSNNQVANMIRVTDWNSGYLDKDNPITKQSRLDFYGKYFMDTVSCSGTGASDSTTAEMWNAVQYEYEHQLSRTFQGDIWTTFAKIDGTMIQQAMARYDYIVLYKQYDHVDFINRAESPNRTEYVSEAFVESMIHEDSNLYIVITIIALVSTLSLTSLLILKKRKHR